MSSSSCQRAASKDRIDLCRVAVVQELHPLDMQKRVAYCWWSETLVAKNPDNLDMTWFCVGGWFRLLRYVSHSILECGLSQILVPFMDPLRLQKEGV